LAPAGRNNSYSSCGYRAEMPAKSAA